MQVGRPFPQAVDGRIGYLEPGQTLDPNGTIDATNSWHESETADFFIHVLINYNSK